MRLRQAAGALWYDWPRFAESMIGRGRWTRFRNRDESIEIDDATGGVRCQWQFTSDLHLCSVSALAARLLMRRALGQWPILFADRPITAGQPRVSFIIGHRGEERLPLLQATLSTIAAQRHVAIECIVVEQSESFQLEGRLPPWVRVIHTPIASNALPYNRAWTFNVGARAATTPLLVLHDNDFLVPADYAHAVAGLHNDGWQVVDLKRFMIYLTREASEFVTRERRVPTGLAVERITQNLLAGGSVAVDRTTYAEVGGFDEAFVGWGGEDNEFWERAETRRAWAFAYLPLVHLWHAPQPEKTSMEMPAAVKRYHEHRLIPPEERIARLLGK
jgi:hypothetical protein